MPFHIPLLPRSQKSGFFSSATSASVSPSAIISSQSFNVDCDFDLAIVGAGIVGTTLASALKNSGLRVALIEAQTPSVAAARRQAYAISLLSGRIFSGIGVWSNIFPKIEKFRQIRLSDADYSGVVQFELTDLNTENLGYVAEHSALLTSLQEFLRDCDNVTWLCPAEVVQVDYQKDLVDIQIKIDGNIKNVTTKLLVAADGAKSRIREAAGIRTRGWKYWQSCITTRIKPEKPHNNIAYERFWPSGPFAILPLPNNICNIVWTAPHAEAKAMMELDDNEFMAMLSRRYGDQMGHLEMDGKRLMFQVQLMQCDRYVLPRLALVGDAAHGCHPVGGQGLNLGIRDAAALADVLQQAIANGEDIGDLRVLKRYESWRKPQNLVILGFTDFLDRMFSNNFLPLLIIRRLGLWLLQNIPPLKIFALRLMTGLSGRSPSLAQH